MLYAALALAALALALVAYDLVQKQHAILRNFPLIGHFRYWLEAVGPELRQYIVTSNDEERPFSRDQRRWVYASAKQQNSYFGFGSDNDLELSTNHLILKHATLPPRFEPAGDLGQAPEWRVPCAKVLGAGRRRHAFRPASIVNTSAMSFGSLSGPAVEALNRGARLAGCLHNTGEGGISDHHRHGGELIWQIGTGYFGCRDERGRFDLARFRDTVASAPVRAIEIKLSQGAKPGHGGILPAAKITPEIARIRGIALDRDCLSPPYHTAFAGPDGLLDFVERLADESGLPVGIKSAVGEIEFWRELARLMVDSGRRVDFVAIDGGEGGTGAAPLVFSDHVALPFKLGFARVFRELSAHGLQRELVLVGAGRLGFPEQALLALAMGCDLVAVAREAMLSVGCIQAQRCHSGHCPTGVATQSRWLARGLEPAVKAQRFAHYVRALRREILELAHACGQPHPALVTDAHFEILDGAFGSRSPAEVFGLDPGLGVPSSEDCAAIAVLMAARAPAEPASGAPAR